MNRLFLLESRGRLRTGARWVGRHLLVLLPVLALAEGVLQLSAPSYKNQVFDQQSTGGHPVEVNQAGFRGRLVPEEKESGEFRVLAVGDSTTFGTGVGANQTWPARLAARITQRTEQHCTVLNAGVPACRVPEIESAWEANWAAYRPDLVILALSNNMPSFGWIRRAEPAKPPYNGFLTKRPQPQGLTRARRWVSKGLHRLCLPSFLRRNSQRALYWVGLANHQVAAAAPYGPMLAHGWLQGQLPPSLAEDAWQLLARDVASLAKAVRAAGAELVVTHLPARFVLTDRLIDNEKLVPHDRLTVDPGRRASELCRTAGVTFVSVTEALLAQRNATDDPLYIPFDFTHLDAEGHDAVAQALVEALEARGKLPRDR